MGHKTRYLIQIVSDNLTPELIPGKANNVFVYGNVCNIIYETAREENHLQFAADYAQQLKYVLKTKAHVEIKELNLIRLFDTDEEFQAAYGRSNAEIFSMYLLRTNEELRFYTDVICELYEMEELPKVRHGIKTHRGSIPFVVRSNSRNLAKSSKEMFSVLSRYACFTNGLLLPPYLGRIVYSSSYNYERKKQ